jgi:hypothetical protein
MSSCKLQMSITNYTVKQSRIILVIRVLLNNVLCMYSVLLVLCSVSLGYLARSVGGGCGGDCTEQ